MDSAHALWIVLVGLTMVLAGAIDSLARRVRLPGVVLYVALGMMLCLADARWAVLGDPGRQAFAFLADLGIVVLLFRVGLESHLERLLARLRTTAARCVLVEDMLEHQRSARALGMRTVWMQRYLGGRFRGSATVRSTSPSRRSRRLLVA